jgi:hypothetical protein
VISHQQASSSMRALLEKLVATAKSFHIRSLRITQASDMDLITRIATRTFSLQLRWHEVRSSGQA